MVGWFEHYLDYRKDLFEAMIRWYRSLSKKARVLWIGSLVLSIAGILLTVILLTGMSHASPHPQTNAPDAILSENYEWPSEARIDGVCSIDGYAVVFSEKGCFAAYRDGELHHMLYAPGQKCGIFRNRIFTIKGGFAYLYDAEGRLEERLNAAAVADRLIYKGEQATVSPYVYRIGHQNGADCVIAEKDGTAAVLMTHRHSNPRIVLTIACIVCFTMLTVAHIAVIIGSQKNRRIRLFTR